VTGNNSPLTMDDDGFRQNKKFTKIKIKIKIILDS
jgi:hypothetical protein